MDDANFISAKKKKKGTFNLIICTSHLLFVLPIIAFQNYDFGLLSTMKMSYKL